MKVKIEEIGKGGMYYRGKYYKIKVKAFRTEE